MVFAYNFYPTVASPKNYPAQLFGKIQFKGVKPRYSQWSAASLGPVALDSWQKICMMVKN